MKTESQSRLITLVLVLLLSAGLKGQEMLGVAFSIYSGISTAAINPALLTGTRVFMDVNIISGNVSVANDMIYFAPENNTIRKAFSPDTTLWRGGRFNWGRTFNYYNSQQDKYAASNVKIIGPSMMLQAERHAFGFTTAFRSFHSGNDIPYEMVVTMYESLGHEEFYNREFENGGYSFASMTWSEFGLTYAYDFYDLYSNRLTFGITAKALFGHEGGYVDMKNARYIIPNGRDVNFLNVDIDVGFALPYSYANEFAYDYAPLVKGYGAGVDIGFVFTKLKSTIVYEREDKLCARPYNDFKYKIGFSLLDIGGIRFTKDTQLHEFNNVSKNWDEFDTIRFFGIQRALHIYSEQFYGDPEASYAGDQIRVGLPTTISLQFDYQIRYRVYLSALWMHPLQFDSQTLWRPAQLAFVPRYENRFLGISMPFSLFNYKDPRLGLAVRVYSITLGTDRLGSLFGVSNFNGMDFYFSFRFNIGKGSCSSQSKGACKTEDFGNEW
jgi:hypothetical protein